MQQYLNELLRKWDLPDWGWNLVLIGISIFIGLLMLLLFALFTRKKVEDVPRFSLFRSLLTHLGKPLSIFLPLFVFNILLPALKVHRVFHHKISKGVEIAMIIVFAWMLIKLIAVVKDWVLFKYDISKSDNLQARKIRTQLQYVRRIMIALIAMITVAMVLLSFENLKTLGSGLLTGVGLGGIIIGFAAQKSLANFLAGFQIAFTQPFRIDDVLVVEGEWGRVEEITLTYVVLKIWDERTLILPITYFTEKPFQNWTRTGSQLLGTAYFYTDHTVPVDEIRAELLKLLNSNDLWDGRVAALQVTDIKEQTVELRALMSANNSGKLFDLRCYVREQLTKFIKEKHPSALPKMRAEITNDQREQVNTQPAANS